ncbi:hypothetical protein QAD02_015936 [Eretmocerus hayati]|uniref:Uncharacterized protein n=1 Tax=Eretmocerus hayati TaxID=131215 RepID=A0ACC2PC30_9HYME|nr:hypothetical protein QAD02_015936 [Eretmocerus hayati]
MPYSVVSVPIEVAWIKADTKAILAIHEHVITNNARLSVTHNDANTWTLNVKDAKPEDRGTYMCQVNTDPMKSQSAYLEVVIPPDIIYEDTSGDIMVPEGGSAKLVCKARGYPKPDINWKREDGSDIVTRTNTGGKAKVLTAQGEVLSFPNVGRSEMGAYLCIASNGVPPSVSKRMMLQVHLLPGNSSSIEFESKADRQRLCVSYFTNILDRFVELKNKWLVIILKN